mmetsp:Transcript_12825/g.18932  ORF Transcript_12825/g.18932 Transcript_12825/m.18932 type:complete len:127 (+) Transcript_12825:1304-1684(+)
MTKDGPLIAVDKDGNIVDDLSWNGDTPHPQVDNENPTCKTLWLSSSSTGDYHDNMNGEMFMQWVIEHLVPCFKKKYPGKKMVPVAENAAYHHVRVIGSLNGLSKKKLIKIAQDHGCTYLELPYTEE